MKSNAFCSVIYLCFFLIAPAGAQVFSDESGDWSNHFLITGSIASISEVMTYPPDLKPGSVIEQGIFEVQLESIGITFGDEDFDVGKFRDLTIRARSKEVLLPGRRIFMLLEATSDGFKVLTWGGATPMACVDPDILEGRPIAPTFGKFSRTSCTLFEW